MDGKIYLVKELINKLKTVFKSKYFWMVVYVLFLLGSFAYVKAALKTGSVDVIEEKKESDGVDIKPVNVSLEVRTENYFKTYSYKKENVDTVMDLMSTLRKKTDFRYEKTAFTDHIQIDHVNGIYPSEGYEWRIYLNNEDVTQQFEDLYLTDDSTYILRLVKK